jgi:hypothetical protein
MLGPVFFFRLREHRAPLERFPEIRVLSPKDLLEELA